MAGLLLQRKRGKPSSAPRIAFAASAVSKSCRTLCRDFRQAGVELEAATNRRREYLRGGTYDRGALIPGRD